VSVVFTLAQCAYKLLTGKLAFDCERIGSHNIAKNIKNNEPNLDGLNSLDLPANAKSKLASVFHKAFAKSQDERYQSASEFSKDLAAVMGSTFLPGVF